jgi:hypothetical protein
MSATHKRPFWMLFPVLPALGTAFWIAFGVMAAASPPPSPPAEVRDPALERMIARFANQARQAIPPVSLR